MNTLEQTTQLAIDLIKKQSIKSIVLNLRVSPKSYKKCPSTHLRTTIASSGTFICPYWRGKDDYNIGDLNKMTFREMWNGAKRKEVMDRTDISVACGEIHCLRHETNNTCIDLKNKLDNNVKISTTSEFDRFI